MIKVATFAEFLTALKASGLDIFPARGGADRTLWKDWQGNVWGITTPGYKNPAGEKSFAYTPKQS
jgi:hypothetical protein